MRGIVIPKALAYPAIALGTGTYFFTALSGSGAVGDVLSVKSASTILKIGLPLASWAALSYLPFSYLTFTNKLILKPKDLFDAAASILSVLASTSFYTSSYEGALMLPATQRLAVAIGVVMFIYRSSYAISSANIFSDRIKKVKADIKDAFDKRDIVKGLMAMTTIGTVVGYAASTTDTSFDAFKALLSLVADDAMSTNIARPLSVAAAFGTTPFTLYSTHRGLRQYVTSKTSEEEPPRDRYTLLGSLFVLPLILGVIGSAMTEDGQMFSRLGDWTKILTLICSVVFAVCATMPSAAEIFRSKMRPATPFKAIADQKSAATLEEAIETTPLLLNR